MEKLDKCKSCLVGARCSHVCDEVKKLVHETYDVEVSCDIPLDAMLDCIEKCIEGKEHYKSAGSPEIKYNDCGYHFLQFSIPVL